jgi:SDR family mycofactocin-dependent oxidoreductase
MNKVKKSGGKSNSRARFLNKTVLVTGSARGQGRADALAFAREGANLILNDVCHSLETIPYQLGSDRDLESLASEIRALGRKVLVSKVDVRDAKGVRKMIEDGARKFGRIDVLYCNAGVFAKRYPQDITEAEWDVMLDVNLKGAFLCSKFAIPQMIKQNYGRIVMNSSVEGLVACPACAHYIAAKHGMIGLTRALAVDLGRYNITVNAVCPGGVATGLMDYVDDFYSKHQEYKRDTAAIAGAWTVIPEHQVLRPEDVTGAVLWLASDEAQCVTGIALPVDTGFTAK